MWDTAGQEEFNALTRQYYRNANGCVLAFSSVDRDSFNAIESWKSKVEDVSALASRLVASGLVCPRLPEMARLTRIFLSAL